MQLVDQAVVGGHRDVLLADASGRERLADETFEHRGGAAHGVMPVHVAVHLVLGIEQGLERGETLFRDGETAVRDDGQGHQQPVHVDHPVRDAAHPGIAGEIVQLVHVERARDEPRERVAALPADQGEEAPLVHADAL